MSILIKGMKMPSKCLFCPCYDVEFGKCEITHKRQSFRAKPSDCPLIPVPPHGRLIDADALDTGIFQAGFSYALTRRKLRYTPGDVRQKIANAPTIIEAEDGE